MKIALLSGGLILGVIILILAWASYPWSLKEQQVDGEIIHLEPDVMVNNEEFPTVLKLLTWNLSYLYGVGSEGLGYDHRERDFYQEKLDKLASEILEWGPDVLCLQEIDFDSRRSGHINQAQYLAQKAGYPYVAEAVSWEANYIPFPYWPWGRHFGKMKSGGAILSKYPILSHQLKLLAKPGSQPWWFNLFYLHRYFQQVVVEMGERKITIINLHLEAFDKDDRQSQVEKLMAKFKEEQIDILAGDFNMVPSSAAKKSKFKDYDDDYENDRSFDLISESGANEVIPESIYSLDEAIYFTFPANRPDRRLDYIFYHQDLKMIKAEVLPSALSDHLPIKASFQIASPKFNPYSQ
jgi:endonuclease/exonuclease/phosphatase family metal-dependent hydrolase